MRIRRILMMLMAALFAINFSACSSDDDGGEVNTADFDITKTTLEFTKVSGTQTVGVKAKNITITSSADWCSATIGNYSEVLNTTPVTVTVQPNTGYNDREATLIVACGKVSKDIKVVQTSSDGIILEQSAYDVSAAGGDITVNLQTNGTITVTSNAEWVTETTTRANLMSETRTFKVAANVGGDRTATIAFKLNDVVENVIISQKGVSTGNITATAQTIAANMYPGWNLGNTLEATGTGLAAETTWQGTKTTQAIIDYIKSLGFKSVRIPCSWSLHMDGSNNIDTDWMTRVTEVVNYCIADGLYVVLNDHYDGNWLENSMDSYDETKAAKLKTMWTQIANNFVNYDEHLMFAGLNEPDADSQAKTDNLVKYEQVFINAVRATGGNNAKRTLVVQGPSTDIDNTNKFYTTLPTDNVSGCMMVEVHFYSPWTFCGLEEDASWGKMNWFWGSANHVSSLSARNTSSSYEESYVESQFAKMKAQFVDKGYPVIIGEYGCQWREVTSNQDEHNASVKLFHKTINQKAISKGIVPFVWGTNYCNQNGTKGTMTVVNRATLKVYNQFAMDGITEGVKAATWPSTASAKRK